MVVNNNWRVGHDGRGTGLGKDSWEHLDSDWKDENDRVKGLPSYRGQHHSCSRQDLEGGRLQYHRTHVSSWRDHSNKKPFSHPLS